MLRWTAVRSIVENAPIDDSGALFVLFAIASHANADGCAEPSIDGLAVLTHLHPDSVTRAIRRLERIGVLTVERTPGRRSVYWVDANTPRAHAGTSYPQPPAPTRGLPPAPTPGEGQSTYAHPPPANATPANQTETRGELHLLGSTPLRDNVGLPPIPDDPVTLAQIRATRRPNTGRRP